jgi:hypothetical protein
VDKLWGSSEFSYLETQSLRLWSIHPKYLDVPGLVAVWREALLAQKVLGGKTSGYINHPQLKRFKDHLYPRRAIAAYLLEIWKEARRQGYSFDKGKIESIGTKRRIKLTCGQLRYEFKLLCDKLKSRDPSRCREMISIKNIKHHPLFKPVAGSIEKWERIKFKIK